MNKEKRKDVLMIDPRNLVIQDGFNVRVEMGDLNELKNSIVENGVREPLRGYRSKEDSIKVVVTNGHRRYAAINIALESGVDIARVPIILEPRGYTEEDRILDMVICNDGKRLTMFEEGKVYKRLVNLGYQQNEVAQKSGRSNTHVSNALTLTNVTKRVQNEIAKGEISDNTVLEIVKSTSDETQQLQMIAGAIAQAQTTGKKKATASNVPGLKSKSPIKILWEVIENFQKQGVQNEKTELIESLMTGIKEKQSVENLIEMFK